MNANNHALLLGTRPPTETKTPIGFDTKPSILAPSSERQIFHHLGQGPMLVFGKTGSGKGSTSILRICLTAPATQSLIVVDCKGEAAAVTAKHRRAMGAQVHVIDPWHIVGPNSASLNPLDLIRDATSPSAIDDAATLAEAIVAESSHHDRFWDTSARNAIAAGSLLLAAHAPRESCHLGALADALGTGSGPTLAAFLAAGFCSDVAGGAVRRECENLASLATQTLASVSATLASHLRPLSSPIVKAAIGSSTIDLDAFSRGEPMSIYLVIPSERLASHRGITRLWINVLVAAVARRRERPKTRTLFVIDEMPAIGHLEAVRSLSFLLRSMGADLVGYFQAMDQLSRLFPQDWQAHLDNAGAILSLSGGAPMRRLVQLTCGEEIARNLPDLPVGQAALIRDGRVEYIEKHDYQDDPAFAHLARLNRFYHSAAEDKYVR